METITSIPSSSAFAREGGGAKATCSFTATGEYTTSDGQVVPGGTIVTSFYVFVEGPPPHELPPDPADVAPDASSFSRGPLENAVRTFTVYCDRESRNGFIRTIQVAMLDPLLDPTGQLTQLRNNLHLDQPTVFTNPVVDRFGGLVTRYPSWLAIHPDAWHTQRSNAATYRGATLYLFAQPRELEFIVDFAPNPEKPSPAYRGIVGCIPAVPATEDTNALPALPELPEQAEPGANGPCMWTPPGPGTVTITARITYTITFWASGYTTPDDDYVWESEPSTYTSGELIAVNTNPNSG